MALVEGLGVSARQDLQEVLLLGLLLWINWDGSLHFKIFVFIIIIRL